MLVNPRTTIITRSNARIDGSKLYSLSNVIDVSPDGKFTVQNSGQYAKLGLKGSGGTGYLIYDSTNGFWVLSPDGNPANYKFYFDSPNSILWTRWQVEVADSFGFGLRLSGPGQAIIQATYGPMALKCNNGDTVFSFTDVGVTTQAKAITLASTVTVGSTVISTNIDKIFPVYHIDNGATLACNAAYTGNTAYNAIRIGRLITIMVDGVITTGLNPAFNFTSTAAIASEYRPQYTHTVAIIGKINGVDVASKAVINTSGIIAIYSDLVGTLFTGGGVLEGWQSFSCSYVLD